MQPKIRSAQFVFTRDTAMKMRVAGKCKYRPKVSIFGQLARTLAAASKNKSTTSAYIASVTFV